MDGVILDSEPFWKEAEIKIFNSLGVPLTEDMCETTTGMRLVDVTKLWHEKYTWDISKNPFDKVNAEIVNALIGLIKQKGGLNTGVIELLEIFNAKGLLLAVASSSDMKIINAVMEKFDIGRYFKVIHSAEFEDYGKPHPAIYLNTAKKLGVLPNECLAIEDSFNGIVAAISARMKTAAYPEKTNFYNPKFAIADIKFRTLKDFTETEFNLLDK